MSLAAVRAALETRLNAMTPALATAWENSNFVPPTLPTPYQEVHLLPAEPDNPTFGPGFYQERGLIQVTLCYPLRSGTKDALARAQAIRAQFLRGTSLVSGGVITTVERTPEIGPASIDADRYRVPVRIRWYANVSS